MVHFRTITDNLFENGTILDDQPLPGPCLTKVDIAVIAQESISDCDVLSNYNLILAEAELEPDKHVEKDVLHNIVSLYVRVRAFSFAKDIIQRYKIKSKQTKAKSPRKEISRSSQDTEDQRNE